MANRISGLTVEIGGDTTKLSTALKSVNSEIKSTQTQLKDVEKLLKLDPSNTELLTQKQKLLTSAISDTKDTVHVYISKLGIEATATVTEDEPEQAEESENKEVVAAEEEAVKIDSDASEEGTGETTDTEEADAKIEAVEEVYPNDGNTEPILYGKATTLVNIRDGNSLDANRVTVIRKGVLVEILEECDNGWFRIKCDAAECGYGYIAGEYLTVGSSMGACSPQQTARSGDG